MVSAEERESLLSQGEQEYDEAVHQLERQEFELALEHFDLAEQAFQQLQDQHWLTFLYHEKFRIFKQAEKPDQALELVDSIVEGYLDTQNRHGLALIHIHKADLLGDKGDVEEALACLRSAEAIIESEKIYDLKSYLYSSLAVVLMMIEDYISAIDYFNQAMKVYSTESNSVEVAWCLHQLGLCYQKLFDLNAAERHLAGAYQSYFKAGDNEAGKEVIEDLKKLYASSNQSDKISELEMIGKQKRF